MKIGPKFGPKENKIYNSIFWGLAAPEILSIKRISQKEEGQKKKYFIQVNYSSFIKRMCMLMFILHCRSLTKDGDGLQPIPSPLLHHRFFGDVSIPRASFLLTKPSLLWSFDGGNSINCDLGFRSLHFQGKDNWRDFNEFSLGLDFKPIWLAMMDSRSSSIGFGCGIPVKISMI